MSPLASIGLCIGIGFVAVAWLTIAEDRVNRRAAREREAAERDETCALLLELEERGRSILRMEAMGAVVPLAGDEWEKPGRKQRR